MKDKIGKYIALFYAVLDTQTAELTYANAGAFPWPLLLQPQEQQPQHYLEFKSTLWACLTLPVTTISTFNLAAKQQFSFMLRWHFRLAAAAKHRAKTAVLIATKLPAQGHSRFIAGFGDRPRAAVARRLNYTEINPATEHLSEDCMTDQILFACVDQCCFFKLSGELRYTNASGMDDLVERLFSAEKFDALNWWWI